MDLTTSKKTTPIIAQHYGRFKGLPWFTEMKKATIFIGGAGGISSWLSLFLNRAGARLIVIDNDTVGLENLAGQLYGSIDVGKPKVKALESVLERLCGEVNGAFIQQFIDDTDGQWKTLVRRSNIVCVGFDNLKARRLVYEEWKLNGKDVSFFVDGRLSAESGQVFVLSKNSPEDSFTAYEQTYFSDAERTELPCTMKATSHCGALIASIMTSQITNWLNNITEDTLQREVSNVEFHLQLSLFETPVYKPKLEHAEI